jgi:hypothetical protein
MNWWDLGEHSGNTGMELATYRIPCAFCGVKGNFETVTHLERVKPGNDSKKLNYDTLKCGNCGNYMFAFWSATARHFSQGGLHSYRVVPWHRETTDHPEL